MVHLDKEGARRIEIPWETVVPVQERILEMDERTGSHNADRWLRIDRLWAESVLSTGDVKSEDIALGEEGSELEEGLLECTKQLAQQLSLEDLKKGDWFASLVRMALKTYSKKVTAEYFRERYKGLPPDAIADQRVGAAVKHAGLEGVATGFLYSGAIAATIGSHGGASPWTVPAAAVAVGADLTFVSAIQLRLAYDLSVIYGRPLDYEDPEDMQDLVAIAFGIKAAESFQQALQKLAPEAARITVKRFASGATLNWLKALPVVGKYLLQRNLIKFAIPVVAVGLGGGLNYAFTKRIGERAKRILRSRPAVEDRARKLRVEAEDAAEALLLALWHVVRADGKTSRQEAWFLKTLRDELIENEQLSAVLTRFEGRLEVEEDEVLDRLKALSESERGEALEACYLAATLDGKVHKRELDVIRKLAELCGVELDEQRIQALKSELS